MLFVVGTSGGVAQQITSEDACDPYAKKDEKATLTEVNSEEAVFPSSDSMDEAMEKSRKSTNYSLAMASFAVGDDAMGAYYLSQS